MKNIILLLVVLLLFSCNENPVKKPSNLLDKDQMENVLFDIYILQAANSFAPNDLSKNNIKNNEFIFKKYNIDSTTLAQNQLYYASDIKAYEKITNKILARIEILQKETDTLNRIKNTEVDLLE